MQQLVKDVGQNWNEYETDCEIGIAKSMQVYNDTRSQVMSCKTLGIYARISYLGFESIEQHNLWDSTHLAAATNQDLRRVYDQCLSKLGEPSYLTFITLVAPSDTEVPPELGAFERRTLDSFMVPYSG